MRCGGTGPGRRRGSPSSCASPGSPADVSRPRPTSAADAPEVVAGREVVQLGPADGEPGPPAAPPGARDVVQAHRARHRIALPPAAAGREVTAAVEDLHLRVDAEEPGQTVRCVGLVALRRLQRPQQSWAVGDVLTRRRGWRAVRDEAAERVLAELP